MSRNERAKLAWIVEQVQGEVGLVLPIKLAKRIVGVLGRGCSARACCMHSKLRATIHDEDDLPPKQPLLVMSM